MSRSDLPSEGAASVDADAPVNLSAPGTSQEAAENSAEASADGSQAGEAGAGDAEDELSLAEASELVGVSTRALRDRVQRGSLPARKVTREGRVLSVVRRSDLMDIYGWMVAEGERKRQAEDAGASRRPVGGKLVDGKLEDSLGDATQKLRQEVDKLQSALVDVTAEMRLVREAQARQREQDIRARADHEREVKALQDRAAALAEELRGQKGSSMSGRTPWEMISVVLLLAVVVVGLWARVYSEVSTVRELLKDEQTTSEPGRTEAPR